MNRTLACAGAIALLALPLSLNAQQDQAPPPLRRIRDHHRNTRKTCPMDQLATRITTAKLALTAICSA